MAAAWWTSGRKRVLPPLLGVKPRYYGLPLLP
nr:hypothetical protein Iba_chr12cCG12380 [Ipomoea batatas]